MGREIPARTSPLYNSHSSIHDDDDDDDQSCQNHPANIVSKCIINRVNDVVSSDLQNHCIQYSSRVQFMYSKIPSKKLWEFA